MPNLRSHARLFVHIGYPKCASTTLQRGLFQRHPDLFYIGPGYAPADGSGLPSSDTVARFYRDLCESDGLTYFAAETERLLRTAILPSIPAGKLACFSHEGIVGTFASYPDPAVKAIRLAKLFPDASIVVVIRNQLTAIKSQYRDWPFDPRDAVGGPPVSLARWIERDLTNPRFSFSYIRSLDYDVILRLYEQLFERGRIAVLALEQLASDPSAVACNLSDFLGIDADASVNLLLRVHENRAVGAADLRYRRMMRRIRLTFPWAARFRHLGQALRRLFAAGPAADLTFSPADETRLRSMFATSNRETSARYGMDLAAFAYPVGDAAPRFFEPS